jgi:hypothetical protein
MYRVTVGSRTLAESGKIQDTRRLSYRSMPLLCPTLEMAHEVMQKALDEEVIIMQSIHHELVEQGPLRKYSDREWMLVICKNKDKEAKIDYTKPLDNILIFTEIDRVNYQLPEEYMNALKILGLPVEA